MFGTCQSVPVFHSSSSSAISRGSISSLKVEGSLALADAHGQCASIWHIVHVFGIHRISGAQEHFIAVAIIGAALLAGFTDAQSMFAAPQLDRRAILVDEVEAEIAAAAERDNIL